MSALDQQAARGINTLVRPDGQEIHLDDIATAAQGQILLDELDGALIAIEAQIAGFDAGTDTRDADWPRRVGIVFRCKRRIRPRLQQRIGELRKAERQAQPPPDKASSAKDGQRRAFVLAAEAMLDRELLTEVWARAQEMRPQAFGKAVTS